MRTIFILIIGLPLALALGIWSAWVTVRSPAPVDAITIGAWQAWPNAGTADVDPYSRARLARTGEIPLGSGEGLALFAEADESGRPLTSRCDYLVTGQTPPARLWTLAVETLQGSFVAGPDRRPALGSDVLLRHADGTFEIAFSTDPQPGNWLSLSGADRFRIVIRLYDTAARTGTGLTTLSMPRIVREGCA